MAQNSIDPQRVITGVVTLSFPHLFEKYSNDPDKEPKYSTMILVDKSDTATVEAIVAAQQAALEAGKDTKFSGKVPKVWRNTFRDGDDEGDLEKQPELAGKFFMTISSNQKPQIVDHQRNFVEDPEEAYPGRKARVSMRAFPFSNSGNKGVSFGLNNVQLLSHGPRLGGGRTSALDEFDEFEVDDEGVDMLS